MNSNHLENLSPQETVPLIRQIQEILETHGYTFQVKPLTYQEGLNFDSIELPLGHDDKGHQYVLNIIWIEDLLSRLAQMDWTDEEQSQDKENHQANISVLAFVVDLPWLGQLPKKEALFQGMFHLNTLLPFGNFHYQASTQSVVLRFEYPMLDPAHIEEKLLRHCIDVMAFHSMDTSDYLEAVGKGDLHPDKILETWLGGTAAKLPQISL